MRKKFKVRRFIFVADRGLLSRGNIEKLREDKGEFIRWHEVRLFEQR